MVRYGDLSYLNIPLIFGDRPIGVMALVETANERRWSDDDIAMVYALGEQAAVAIEHARLYRRIQDQAITDGLTGLYNHRHFYERLEQEVARAGRYGTPVLLLMLDLDDFKAYNDLHGHLAGDAVLREVARILLSELRAKLDVAARYGGEEFSGDFSQHADDRRRRPPGPTPQGRSRRRTARGRAVRSTKRRPPGAAAAPRRSPRGSAGASPRVASRRRTAGRQSRGLL